jgi:anti-sigma factor (TIGR02949 family)
MTCRDALPLLRDVADRALPLNERAPFEAHFASCPDCAARLEAETDLKRVLRARLRPAPAPPGLAGDIARRVREEAGRRPRWDILRRRKVLTLAGAALLLVAIAVGGLRLLLTRTVSAPDGSAMVAELVDDHIRYLQVKEPAEVATADPREAERWFASRLDGTIELPQFPDDRARLIGGRLCYVLDRRVALLFYERDGGRLSLFVMGAEGLPPAPSPEDGAAVERTVEESKGFGVACWSRRGRMYALVGDAGRAGLARLVSSAYRE